MVIPHHKQKVGEPLVWRTWLLIAYSNERPLCITNSHHITNTFLYKRLGERTFWTWEWKGRSVQQVTYSIMLAARFNLLKSRACPADELESITTWSSRDSQTCPRTCGFAWRVSSGLERKIQLPIPLAKLPAMLWTSDSFLSIEASRDPESSESLGELMVGVFLVIAADQESVSCAREGRKAVSWSHLTFGVWRRRNLHPRKESSSRNLLVFHVPPKKHHFEGWVWSLFVPRATLLAATKLI